MKASFLLAAVLLVGLPLAVNATTPQQQRMAECSAKNKGLKGDAYKTAQMPQWPRRRRQAGQCAAGTHAQVQR